MSLLSTFETDPFFANGNLPQALALEHRQLIPRREMKNTDPLANPLALMQNVMNQMGKMMNQMENIKQTNGPQGRAVSFSSSTIIRMDRRNGGKPRVFQVVSERLCGPEGEISSMAFSRDHQGFSFRFGTNKKRCSRYQSKLGKNGSGSSIR